jgi:Sulfotransferase domain
MRPNLLVIGAAKCGTTSLHEYLNAHPAIAMSREKELDFFVEEKNWGRGLDWYEAQFDDAPVRGESSVSYAAFPEYEGVPERIAAALPDVRLVYLVRDPVERVVSHFFHHSIRYPGQSLDGLGSSDLGRRLVDVSRYWTQLSQYLDHFAADRILVVDSDELRDRRRETLARIFAFLGVDPAVSSPAFSRRHNVAVGPRHRFWRHRPSLQPEVREQLADQLREEVEQLRSHTGLAFAGWSL